MEMLDLGIVTFVTGWVTVIWQETATPLFAVAVTMQVPAFLPVTRPRESTVAIFLSEEVHVILLLVASAGRTAAAWEMRYPLSAVASLMLSAMEVTG